MFDFLKKKLKSFETEVAESAKFEVVEREKAQSRPATPTTRTTGALPSGASQGQPRMGPTSQQPPQPDRAAPGRPIPPDRLDELLYDLELTLMESDVAMEVAGAIRENLKKSLTGIRVTSPLDAQQKVEAALREAILAILSDRVFDFDKFILEAKKPAIVMFVGVNGTGKTTVIARLAHRLRENGYSSVVAAGDTFRAGAIEQLEKHADKLAVKIVKHEAGGDPAAVAYDAIEHAKSRQKDVVLIDTAGRMQTNTNLMDEMKKIKRVAKPDLVVFVGDALAGNDAIEQAKKFDAAVGIGAVMLTKVDTDSKGGAAISIAHAVGRPVAFLGVGQDYGDLIPFEPEWLVGRIFEN